MQKHEHFLEAFAACFAEAEREYPDLLDLYRGASAWTRFMLDQAPPGLLRKVARRWAEACGYERGEVSLHGQWYTLDLCMVSPAYEGAGDYWRSRTVLAIEHENGSDVETEMWKLAHWRSDLSVLVFYDFSEAECATDQTSGDIWLPGVARRDWLGEKLKRLGEIVSSTDPAPRRHLLLIGQKAAPPASKIIWRFSIWDGGAFADPRPAPAAASGSRA